MKYLFQEEREIELSKKDQIMETLALVMCFMVLFASAIKVVFL
ncbi:MAG: hypothetical protein NXI23_20885 [Bacteroidetes bacterium]|jgi:hypothetical protein|nr:hypothetical protein [Bacteroidota bacterium]MDF1868320.1 hypothetical protein [Saprospiraceae bacterium]